jgi:hypothetical protein
MKMPAFLSVFFLIAAAALFFCGEAEAEGRRTSFELGIGGGSSLNGLGTGQALIVSAVSIPISGEILHFRLEGDLEFINWQSKTMFVAGVSPLLRATLPLQRISPFIEIGPGVNYANHVRFAGRELGGSFFFSAMGSVGVEIRSDKRVMSISYRVRHLSNGGLQERNQGMNSHYIMLSLAF